ncbi:hypothetical protein ACIA8O_24955 [Kitasatospora sp. NPDC051853]|uniref:hypothetical protein n=1 Tax=Kitasatospora sp. NPDC051853 TaxID=3364058 RepID=UPI00379454B9
MRRMIQAFTAVVAVGLLTTACGTSGSPSGSTDSGAAGSSAAGSAKSAPADTAKSAAKVLPVAIDGPQKDVVQRGGGDALKVTPAPDSKAPVVEKVEHALREDVLSAAHVPGTTSAKCADGITMKAGAVSQCVVTYEGAEIPYEVKISDKYTEGSFVFSYTKTQKKALLVAKEIYNRFHERYGSTSTASRLACDEIPAAKTFDFGADTGYTCQYWSEHGTKDGKPGYVTVKVRIGSTRGSIALDEVR